jgi:hypothetical protein
MIKKIHFFNLLLFFTVQYSICQNKKVLAIESFPQEKVFAHTNSNFFITGEEILFKIYCLNSSENTMSTISKIGYIELVDENNNSVFKQKLRLKNGEGNGAIFINQELKTGTYKFIAYTQWMRNSHTFFEENIFIVNPFSDKLKKMDSLEINNYTITEIKNTNFLELKTDQKTYLKREKVVLNFDKKIAANVSISVRKIDSLHIPSKISVPSFLANYKSSKLFSKKEYLPELRGQLFYGKVISKSNENVSNLKIGVSLIGYQKVTKISVTNLKGEFYLNLDKSYDTEDVIIEVLDHPKDTFTIELNNNNELEKSFQDFTKIHYSATLRELVKQKSLHNQIENAYNEAKQPFVKSKENNTSIFDENPNKIVYHLDDYTRFKTLKDVTVEILQDVWISEKNNIYNFHVRDYNLEVDTDLKTLLIVDGFIVNNHADFVFFDALKIKTIEIVKEKYFFGAKKYQGIINIETLNSAYKPNVKANNVFTLLKPSEEITFFSPNYSSSKNEKIPDFRYQLYWNPSIKNASDSFSFYSSDVTGTFEIIVEGFTFDGKPIHEKIFFNVK